MPITLTLLMEIIFEMIKHFVHFFLNPKATSNFTIKDLQIGVSINVIGIT